jgi:hypothetical protein
MGGTGGTGLLVPSHEQAPPWLAATRGRSWFDRLRYAGTHDPSPENVMSTSKPKTPTPAPQDPLDEALEETFPASDPIAVEPEPGKRESGKSGKSGKDDKHDKDGKKKHHDGGHHGGKH